MTDSTKATALGKLDKLTVKVGYPNKWQDYSALEVKSGNGYLQNLIAYIKWSREKSLAKIGENVDKNAWAKVPQDVNAYYSPSNNEIVFTVAVLQAPFFDYKADDALNYGGIGAVIGHEITHGLDNNGSRYDADGNVTNWWSAQDLNEFTQRTNKLVDQFNQIQVEGSSINGKLTLGENIADLGGVSTAYDALQNSFKESGKPEKLDGFTPEQRFFIAWATNWRTLARKDALLQQLATDVHSPGMYRATQPLRNIDGFYEAFGIKEGDAMYLATDKRAKIW